MRTTAVLIAMLMASAASATVVQSDVVVMRRVITRPNPTTPPVVTPPVSPPVSTPTPDPSPTPAPTATFAWEPLLAVNPNQSAGSGTWLVDTTTSPRCFDVATGLTVSQSSCLNVAKPSSIAVFGVPATLSRNLRRVSIDRAAVLARAPTITNIESLCADAVVFVNVEGVGQPWRVSCDPETTREHYERYATTAFAVAGQTVPVDGVGVLQTATHLAAVGCRDTDTGGVASPSSLCDHFPNGPTLGYFDIPIKGSVDLHRIEYDWDALLAKAPGLVNRTAWCSSSLSVLPEGTTTAQDWSIGCTPGYARNHYERYVSTLSFSGTDNVLPLTQGVSAVGSGAACRDTDTGTDVAASICQFLRSTVGAGTFRVPVAGYSVNLRKVAFDRAVIRSMVSNDAAATALCGGKTVSVRATATATGTDYVNYTTTCSLDNVREHYEVVAQSVGFDTTSKLRLPGDGLLSMVAFAPACRDTDASANNRLSSYTGCSNFPSNFEATFGIPYDLRPESHQIRIRRSDIRAHAPYATNLESTGMCANESLPIYYEGVYSSGWQIVCDDDEPAEAQYALVVTNFKGLTYYPISADRRVPFSSGLTLAADTTCYRRTATGFANASANRCLTISNRSEISASVTVPVLSYSNVKDSSGYMTVTIAPLSTTDYPQLSVSTMCSRSYQINTVLAYSQLTGTSSASTYKIKC